MGTSAQRSMQSAVRSHIVPLTQRCVLVMDEVGGSTSQKGDGRIGGRLMVCGKGMVPQNKITAKEKMDAPWTHLTQLQPHYLHHFLCW